MGEHCRRRQQFNSKIRKEQGVLGALLEKAMKKRQEKNVPSGFTNLGNFLKMKLMGTLSKQTKHFVRSMGMFGL